MCLFLMYGWCGCRSHTHTHTHTHTHGKYDNHNKVIFYYLHNNFMYKRNCILFKHKMLSEADKEGHFQCFHQSDMYLRASPSADNTAKEAWPISLSVTMHPCHWSPLLTTQHCKGGMTHLSLRHHAPLSLKSFADNASLQIPTSRTKMNCLHFCQSVFSLLRHPLQQDKMNCLHFANLYPHCWHISVGPLSKELCVYQSAALCAR